MLFLMVLMMWCQNKKGLLNHRYIIPIRFAQITQFPSCKKQNASDLPTGFLSTYSRPGWKLLGRDKPCIREQRNGRFKGCGSQSCALGSSCFRIIGSWAHHSPTESPLVPLSKNHFPTSCPDCSEGPESLRALP